MGLMMLLSGLVCVVVALATAISGLAIVDRSRVPPSLSDSTRHALDGPTGVATGPRFKPLDFGKDQLTWPSAVKRPASRTPRARWPSEIWGAAWRERSKPEPTTTERSALDRAPDRPSSSAHAPKPNTAANPPPQPSPQQKQTRSRSTAQATRTTKPTAQSTPMPKQKAQRTLATHAPGGKQPVKLSAEQLMLGGSPKPKPKPKRPATKPTPSGNEGPSGDQVRAIIADVGLARAVDVIRKDTGWDFQRAARHLATVLRDSG